MLKDAFTKENLIRCAEELKRRGFKPGVDGMTAETALMWLKINGDKLCRQVLGGSYEPMPLGGFTVAKSDGKPRIISKLTAIDTVIQRCLLDYLGETVEPLFSEQSFAYRKGKGVPEAVSAYCAFGQHHRFAAKIDPASCYDNIDRTILAGLLNDCGVEQAAASLILAFAGAPLIIEGQLTEREKGIPQGAPLSPVLCNIYLTPIDTLLEEAGADFVRYADDIVVFADSAEQIGEYADAVKAALNGKLGLKINKNKLNITAPADLVFLGHSFEKKHSGLIANQKKSCGEICYGWAVGEIGDSKRTVDIVSDGILRQKDFSLLFDTEDADFDIPVRETGIINVYSDVIFDAGVIKRAFKNGITVNIFSNEERLLGRFVPNTGLRAPSVIFEQLQTYYYSDERLELARCFLLASFHNTRLVIRYYNKKKENEVYTEALRRIDRVYADIKDCNDYERLLTLEAKGRESYYSCFDSFLAGSGFEFEKRTRKPPENEVDSLISFGNMLLYNYIAAEIYKSSLDIRVGFLHATNKRAESLNLDIAEIFKPLIVDRTVFTLINRRELTKDDFEESNGGVYLTADGKRTFIAGFYEKLDTTLQIKDKELSYRQIIRAEVQKLVRRFRDGEKYKPYKQVR